MSIRTAAVIGLFMLSSTALTHAAQPINKAGELDARAQIEDTLNRYTYGLDNKDSKQYASAFIANGVLWYKDKALTGHEQIEGFIINAKPTQVQRHLRLNSLVEFQDRDNAKVTSYFVTIYGDTSTGFTVGLVGTYNDTFVRDHGHWLIKERKPGIVGPDPDTLKKDAEKR